MLLMSKSSWRLQGLKTSKMISMEIEFMEIKFNIELKALKMMSGLNNLKEDH